MLVPAWRSEIDARKIEIRLFSNLHKGPSINYVGKVLPIFDPPPPSVGKFTA